MVGYGGFTRNEANERWQKRYSQNQRLKAFVRPAYNEAVAPIVAGAIAHLCKRNARLLVVGGGTGVFSRELLPDVKRLLKQKRRKVNVSVVETDVTESIAKAPGGKAIADVHALPFKDASFDFVIGESMLHQGKIELLPHRIGEIKRVLRDNGSFVHVQDITPSPQDYLTERELARAKIAVENPARAINGREDSERISGAVLNAHLRQVEAFHIAARMNYLSSASLIIEGESLVPASARLDEIEGKKLDGNTVEFNLGRIRSYNAKNVPASKKNIKYHGLVTIFRKAQKASDLIEYLNEF